MASELDLYKAGEVGPYSSPDQPLAPSPDTWGNTQPREIDSYQKSSGSQPQLFGEALPAGTTQQQIDQTLTEIAVVISADLMRLKHPQSVTNAALTWWQTSAKKTPQREVKRHSYNLYDQAGDWLAESFGNAMARAGATQKFVSDSLWLMGELNKRLNAQQKVGTQTAHGRAPKTADPLDSLTDAQYNAVIKANENAAAQTETTLRRKWSHSYDQNIMVAQQFLNNLPARERDHFEQYTTGFIHSLNTAPVLEGLFNMAIGAGSLPTGGGIQAEINQIESLMRTDNRAYRKDLQIQARLRVLYDLRGH